VEVPPGANIVTDRELDKALATALPQLFIDQLRYAVQRDEEYPSLPKLRKRIESMKVAAELLLRELPDPRISALLLNADPWIENEVETAAGLRDISTRAARVLARAPRKQGRVKLYPETGTALNSMELCALMAALVWQKRVGTWPGKNNVRAHQFCEQLWTAADGPARTSWGKADSVVVWRNYIKAAWEYRPPHELGVLLERRLGDTNHYRPSPTAEHKVPGSSARLLYDHPASQGGAIKTAKSPEFTTPRKRARVRSY
jgi:hypothetical protein